MLPIWSKFARDENGAVTVDWVVLTAAIVGFAAATIAMVVNVTTDKSSGIGAKIDTYSEDLID